MQIKKIFVPIFMAMSLFFTSCSPTSANSVSLSDIPEYTGDAYVVLNDNVPDFPDSDFTSDSFETYSDLDSLGRCGIAYANIGQDLMPTEKRGNIGQVKPSGWHTVKYDNVDGKYLYNRCHLIGYQITMYCTVLLPFLMVRIWLLPEYRWKQNQWKIGVMESSLIFSVIMYSQAFL